MEDSENSAQAGIRSAGLSDGAASLPTTTIPTSEATIMRRHAAFNSTATFVLETLDDRVKRFVMSQVFEGIVGTLIVVNCIMLGLEAEMLIGNIPDLTRLIQVSDHLFTALFTIELAFRMHVLGWRVYVPSVEHPGNFMDAVLVIVTGIFLVWIVPLIFVNQGQPSVFRAFLMLRTVRLMRLVRVVQRVPIFREVWLLMRGITSSARVLVWTIVVVAFVTYVFAIFGVVLISTDLKSDLHHSRQMTNTQGDLQQFDMLWDATGGVFAWMRTLVQVLTLDSWNSILRPLMEFSPSSWIFFYLYISVATIVLLNLVTAILVENAFKCSSLDEAAEADRMEQERRVQLEALKELFSTLDDDGSGEVSWQEFKAGFSKPEIRKQLAKLDIQQDDLKSLFDLLDTGDGVLSLEEFFTGIQRVRGVATAKEAFKIAKRVEHLVSITERNNKVVERLLQAHSKFSDNIRDAHERRSRSQRTGADTRANENTANNARHPTRSPVLQPESPIVRMLSSDLLSEEDIFRTKLDTVTKDLEHMTKDVRAQLEVMNSQMVKCTNWIDELVQRGTSLPEQKRRVSNWRTCPIGIEATSLPENVREACMHNQCTPGEADDENKSRPTRSREATDLLSFCSRRSHELASPPVAGTDQHQELYPEGMCEEIGMHQRQLLSDRRSLEKPPEMFRSNELPPEPIAPKDSMTESRLLDINHSPPELVEVLPTTHGLPPSK
eukprot:TRINITY_DN17204_c0_g1_i3.p1 TRINITY_DN17204_c0_g1~~TRINITY_DN17204_c0_g1_i3.p1  ORF type:complete len:741 (+),score=87.78 TRINITY_DN17204_c0_g1_i3:63-2225(+)